MQATEGFAYCNIVKEAVQSQKLTLSEMFTSTHLFIECWHLRCQFTSNAVWQHCVFSPAHKDYSQNLLQVAPICILHSCELTQLAIFDCLIYTLLQDQWCQHSCPASLNPCLRLHTRQGVMSVVTVLVTMSEPCSS